MGLFENLKTDGLEEAQDRLGGGGRVETDGYFGTIKVAYAGQSQGGARNVTLVLDLNGREYSETIYITNKKGENWFPNKDDQTKKVPLPGFTVIDDLCLVTTGKPLAEQNTEEKTINVYDFEQRKELPKSVPVLTELTGKRALFGIVKQIKNKQEKDHNGVYVPTSETREENFIEKVFEHETRATVPEAKKAAESGTDLVATFYGSWIEKNKGKTRDKTSDVTASGGRSGRPGQANGAPPTSSQGTARKSLFGN